MLTPYLMAALKSEPLSALPWWRAADHLEELGETEWATHFRARGDQLANGLGKNFYPCYPCEENPNDNVWHFHVLDDLALRYLDKQRSDLGRTNGQIPVCRR